MKSLVEAGAGDWDGPKILASDGPREDSVDPDWFRFESPRSDGSAVAFVRALRYALALDPRLEHLTFLEDDISLSKNALRYAARIEVPSDVAFVTWFTYDYDYSFPKHEPNARHPSTYPTPVLAIRPARFFILAQACTFTRETVDRLLDCPRATEEWPKKDGHDEMIAWALGDALYATHFPILVQHTGGLNSAVLMARGKTLEDPGDPAWTEERRSPYYKGDEFDASSLLDEVVR